MFWFQIFGFRWVGVGVGVVVWGMGRKWFWMKVYFG